MMRERAFGSMPPRLFEIWVLVRTSKSEHIPEESKMWSSVVSPDSLVKAILFNLSLLMSIASLSSPFLFPIMTLLPL